MSSSDLSPRASFPDVVTGEVLPATPENAHRVLMAVKEMEVKLRTVKSAVTAYVLEESQRVGTKTFNVRGGKVELTGGPTSEIDPVALGQLLREAGCPEDRIDEVIVATITYKVNRSVLRQLTSANGDYAAAADLATQPVEKDYRASAK